MVSAEGMQNVSLPLDDIIDGFTETQKTTSTAFRHEEYYILCYDSDADGDNDSALIYDTRFNSWVIASNFKFEDGTVKQDGTTLTIDSILTTPKIYNFWDGSLDDDGTAISMDVETKGWDFSRFFSRKHLRQAYYQTNKVGAFNLVTQAKVDGTLTGATQNISMNAGEFSHSFETSVIGDVIQLRFTNSGSTDKIELRSILALAEMFPAGDLT